MPGGGLSEAGSPDLGVAPEDHIIVIVHQPVYGFSMVPGQIYLGIMS